MAALPKVVSFFIWKLPRVIDASLRHDHHRHDYGLHLHRASVMMRVLNARKRGVTSTSTEMRSGLIYRASYSF
jgi:hypothetical protein